MRSGGYHIQFPTEDIIKLCEFFLISFSNKYQLYIGSTLNYDTYVNELPLP